MKYQNVVLWALSERDIPRHSDSPKDTGSLSSIKAAQVTEKQKGKNKSFL